MRERIFFVLLVLLAATPAAAGPEERTPFDMVRWTESGPEVQVEGTWYELVALDGLPLSKVIEACKKLDRDRWEKRFCEDLVAALKTVGHDMGAKVTLEVRVPGDTATKKLPGVAATNDKRDRIRDARPWKSAGAASVKRVEREHATKADPAFTFLAIRHHDEKDARLSRARALADLDQLEWLIENVYAYRDLRPFDYRAAFDTLRLGIRESGIAKDDFHIQLRKLVALFGDGHARVRGVLRVMPEVALPFALAEADGHVVAVKENGEPIDAQHPYVKVIGGVPIAKWLDAAARLNARGSAAFQRSQALDVGLYLGFLEMELGLPNRSTLDVTVTGKDGEKVLEWDLFPADPERFRGPKRDAGPWVGKGIRYVRIPSMDSEPEFLNEVMQGVLGSPKTKALVLDVRGNGGGSRLLLRALLPHLMPAAAEPLACNVAAYRLPPGETYDEKEGNLANRFLRPPDWHGWTPAERKAAEARVRALTSFEANFASDRKRFTPLHVMVVSPAAGRVRFLGPIAILIDGGCFSATDIFVGALEQLPNVTLVGTNTGGGSGRSRRYRLAHSGLEVRLSSMASFRPNGSRYDGVGIAPDIEVGPTISDLTGETDTVLEKAVEHLRKQLGE